MTLIDTSAWIHSLRPDGDSDISEKVWALLQAGEASWCPMVKLELWNGAHGPHEQKVLREMEQSLIELPIQEEVWKLSHRLARKARKKGVSVPATDLLIWACAEYHSVPLLHSDAHYQLLADL